MPLGLLCLQLYERFAIISDNKGDYALESLKTIWQNLDWNFLISTLVTVVSALTCITLHELAHGYVAYRLGDNTAKYAGRLTLNPLRHIDIFGLAMMVVFKFGWAKPVPINMRQFKNPRRDMAITALAGPMCNVLLTCAALFFYGALFYPVAMNYTLVGAVVLEILASISYLSIAFAIFNLLPISPLDGSKILYSFLPEHIYRKILRYERYGMIVLFVLLSVMRRTGVNPLGSITGAVYDFLFNIAAFASQLVAKIM